MLNVLILHSALLLLTDLSELQNKNKVCSFLKQGSVWGDLRLESHWHYNASAFELLLISPKNLWKWFGPWWEGVHWDGNIKGLVLEKAVLEKGGGGGRGWAAKIFSVFFLVKGSLTCRHEENCFRERGLGDGLFLCVCAPVRVCVHPCVCVCAPVCARMRMCACVFWVKGSPTCKYEMTGFRKHSLEELFCFAGFLGQGFIDMDTWLQSKQSQGREIGPRGEMASRPAGRPSGVLLYPNIMLQLGDKQRALSQHCHRQWRRLSTSVAGFLQTCIATISLLSVFSSNTLINEMQLVTHNWECQKNENHKRKASQNPDNKFPMQRTTYKVSAKPTNVKFAQNWTFSLLQTQPPWTNRQNKKTCPCHLTVI